MSRVYNFSAGPSMLPLSVLEKAQKEFLAYGESGQSVLEMSHRSKVYSSIIENTFSSLKRVLNIPDNYKIGFIQGGASMQFAMVPMNIMNTKVADYFVTGQFSGKAQKEAAKFGSANVVASSKDKNFTYIPDVDSVAYSENASYIHICENNTIYGTRFTKLPCANNVPLVSDMSSCILSRPTPVEKYGLIYFGVQKNVAPAGMATVIIRDDLLNGARDDIIRADMLDYKTLIEADSMYNTPPTFNIYMMGLVLDWIEKEMGGLGAMEKHNNEKAALLYDFIDNSSFFNNPVNKPDRSIMNVVFTSKNEETDAKFCKESEGAGFVNLKGHRSVGGMRASIYNAMPLDGIKNLVEFMHKFEKENA